MKKYFSIIAILSLVVVNQSCKKDHDQQPPQEIFTKFPEPTWQEDQTGKYPLSMTAVVTIPEKLRPSMQQGDFMGAFINNECRGLGTLIKIDGALSVFYILIHGTASEQSKIKFSYYSKSTYYLYSTPEILDYNVDSNFGTPDAPQMLELVQMKYLGIMVGEGRNNFIIDYIEPENRELEVAGVFE